MASQVQVQTREATAVRKASDARLLQAMREAARIVSRGLRADGNGGTWARGYAAGAGRYTSATVRACVLTAWGS